MHLIFTYAPHHDRLFRASRRFKPSLSVFPSKAIRSYLDYSVDFSRRLKQEEEIISGEISVKGKGLTLEGVYGHGSYVTGFISGGLSNHSYYLIFTAKTNQSRVLSQEMILSTYGQEKGERPDLKYLALRPGIKPPTNRPPFNAVRLNNRYLLDDNGFFIGIS